MRFWDAVSGSTKKQHTDRFAVKRDKLFKHCRIVVGQRMAAKGLPLTYQKWRAGRDETENSYVIVTANKFQT
jgi:hypothetical protein